MDIRIDSLIPFEKIKTDVDAVIQTVEKNGKVVLLRDNLPVYIILKYDAGKSLPDKTISADAISYTLQDAMKLVLLESKDCTMHAADLADEIYNRKLYLKKNGEKAQYNQIRARCGHYPDLFEALPGNFIKLKEDVKI